METKDASMQVPCEQEGWGPYFLVSLSKYAEHWGRKLKQVPHLFDQLQDRLEQWNDKTSAWVVRPTGKKN